VHFPFDLKDVLKRRRYRSSDGSDGNAKPRYIDVADDAVDGEVAFLESELCMGQTIPSLQRLTAFTRFSNRA
jgi:DNA polymerase III subunit epsilon